MSIEFRFENEYHVFRKIGDGDKYQRGFMSKLQHVTNEKQKIIINTTDITDDRDHEEYASNT